MIVEKKIIVHLMGRLVWWGEGWMGLGGALVIFGHMQQLQRVKSLGPLKKRDLKGCMDLAKA